MSLPIRTRDREFPLPLDRPFTRSQARAVGVPDAALSQLARNGGLIRPVLHGVYVGASVADSLELRCAALALVVPQDAFVCDTTAAWLYAGAKALPPGAHLHVPTVSCFRPSDGGRLRNAIAASGERWVEPSDLQEFNGLVVTTPLRTAVDLGRLQSTADMRLWGMSCMLGLGLFTHEELKRQVLRFARQRGVVLLRVLVERVDGGLDSFGEAALDNRWWDAGLPRPSTQVEVHRGGGASYFIDLGLPDDRFGGEYDGAEFHSSETDINRDAGRREWLRLERQWLLEPYRRHHVFGPLQNAERRLREAYADMRALGPRTFIL